jgi:putative GTP pyrophosphokinase
VPPARQDLANRQANQYNVTDYIKSTVLGKVSERAKLLLTEYKMNTTRISYRGHVMTKNVNSFRDSRDEFLRRENFTAEEFKTRGLDWALLVDIFESHTRRIDELQYAANYVSQRLQPLHEIHSIRIRIKDPEHLIAKIIRKKIEDPQQVIDTGSYHERITDLIGVRAMHLFKDDWRNIHEFITNAWELNEDPIAYYRKGDHDAFIKSFKEAGCCPKEHQFGYRSIHYIIKSKPAKSTHYVELQVRTVFEEGWSEIDHKLRYPHQSDDQSLVGFLNILNRLAGSADEMGTFIKQLGEDIRERSDRLEIMEKELKSTVSRLEISEEAKKKLEKQIDELRRTSRQSIDSTLSVCVQPQRDYSSLFGASDAISYISTKPSGPSYITEPIVPSFISNRSDISVMPSFSLIAEHKCQNCGAKYSPGFGSVGSGTSVCTQCGKVNIL